MPERLREHGNRQPDHSANERHSGLTDLPANARGRQPLDANPGEEDRRHCSTQHGDNRSRSVNHLNQGYHGFSPTEENPRQHMAGRTTAVLCGIHRLSASTNSLSGQCRPMTTHCPPNAGGKTVLRKNPRTVQHCLNACGRGHSPLPNIVTAAGKRPGGSRTRDGARSRTLHGARPPPIPVLAQPCCGNCTGRAGQPGLHFHAQFNRLDSQPSKRKPCDPSSAQG